MPTDGIAGSTCGQRVESEGTANDHVVLRASARNDLEAHRSDDVGKQGHRHRMCTDGADRLGDVHLLAIEADAELFVDGSHDVVRGDRAEQATLCTGLRRDRDGALGERGGDRLGRLTVGCFTSRSGACIAAA